MKLCIMGKSYQNMHVLMTKITGNITIKILVAKMIQGQLTFQIITPRLAYSKDLSRGKIKVHYLVKL